MDFKKISDMFTLAVPVLIVCSCIRLLTYYHHWNIPILEYLSASEILLLFIQPVLVIAALGAIYFASTVLLAAVMLLVVKMRTARDGDRKDDTPKENKTVDESQSETKHPVASLIFAILSFGGIAGILFQGMWSEFKVFPALIFHVLLWLGVAGVVRSMLPPSEQQDRTKPLLVGTLVVLLSASFFYGRYQARSTETNPTRLELVLRDETLLKADPDRIYVGKTSNYYFFHSKNETSIIPVGEVRATYIK